VGDLTRRLKQDDEGVSAELHRADGPVETVRVRYVCGCDGAGSIVRQALGIDFLGGTYTQRFFVADVRGSFHSFLRDAWGWGCARANRTGE